MSERDVLIERLEKKLIEKEKEISELRRMLSEKSGFNKDFESLKESIKKSILEDLQRSDSGNDALSKKVVELESRIVELRKAVESLMSEIVYIKSELKGLAGLAIDNTEAKERRAKIVEKVRERSEIQLEEGGKEGKVKKEIGEPESKERKKLEKMGEMRVIEGDIIDGESYEKEEVKGRNFIVGKLSNDWVENQNENENEREKKNRRSDDGFDDDLIVCG